MIKIIISTLVALALVMGGTTTGLVAAKQSQPDDLFYPVKTMVEDIRMNLTNAPEARVDLAMAYADERISEVLELAEANKDPDASLVARYNQHLLDAYTAMAELDDAALVSALQEVGNYIQKHDQDTIKGRTKMPADVGPNDDSADTGNELPLEAMYQKKIGAPVEVQEVIDLQLSVVETALTDLNQFRAKYGGLNAKSSSTGGGQTTDPGLQPEIIPPAFGPGPGAAPDDASTDPQAGYANDELEPAPFGYEGVPEDEQGESLFPFHWAWPWDTSSSTQTHPGKRYGNP